MSASESRRPSLPPAVRVLAGRMLGLGVGAGKPTSEEAALLEELEMELALLREENARLKVERHRPPDPGRIIERMRSLAPVPQPAGSDGIDDGEGEGEREIATVAPARALEDAVADYEDVRDGLLEACREIREAAAAMRDRLAGLPAQAGGGSAETVLGAEELELELALTVQPPPEAARDAA